MLPDAPLRDKLPIPPSMWAEIVVLPHLSPREIVPEEYQNRLMAIDDAFTRCYFEIGDIANELIAMSPQFSKQGFSAVTHEDVYAAVAQFCHREPRTVRYYTETAAFFSPAVRHEFSMLPFAYFVVARSFEDRWREVLEYGAEHPTISASSLRVHFVGRDNDVQEDVVELDAVLQNAESTDVPASPAYVPRELSGHSRSVVLSAISGLIDNLRKLANDVSLREDTRDRIIQILHDIANVLPEIRRDIAAKEN